MEWIDSPTGSKIHENLADSTDFAVDQFSLLLRRLRGYPNERGRFSGS